MNNQLYNISTQYRKFSKGQYVEHTQFNEFLDFFEDQDRLSRVMLQGVGVVCGFKPQFIYTNNKISGIQLSQGIAITTDGDLLTLNNKSRTKNVTDDLYVSELKTIDFDRNQYTHWKAYDNYKAIYPAFYKSSGQQIELWELATGTGVKTDFEPLTTFTDLEDKYLLLYLEAYEKEVKPCKGVDCDNHGTQQVKNLKVLITTAAGIAQILQKDIVSPHPLSLNLIGEEKLKRVILTPVPQSVEGLKQAFKSVTTNSGYNSIFANIDSVCTIMKIPTVDKSGFTSVINSLAAQNKNFQYTYGVLKDLTDTYSEIVKLFSKTFTKYLPGLESFPKHIMLGKLIPCSGFDTARHQFYDSPVLDNEKMNYSRLRLLIERFNKLATGFKDPSLALPATDGDKIKITPSQDISPLGSKAIPFYYDLTQSFLDAWNFDKTRNRTSDTNLSYTTINLADDDHIQNPVLYNIDKKSFYRIEGHQGLDYRTVVNNIREIKDDKQLGFDVMALSLTQLRDNKDVSMVYFTDYIEKHPGLEYVGGVKRGGTFAVVYESESNPAVIADFALPYICCTPKSDISLSLPVSTLCNDALPVIFKVTPTNGVVKADVITGLTGGVKVVNGQYMFDPAGVEDNLVGTEIAFLVNGKPTNCVVKVLPVPAVIVKATDFVYPEGNLTNTAVTFNVSGAGALDYDYQWDFLGNKSYISRKPDSNGDVRYDYLKIDATKPVNVLVSGKGCTQSIEYIDWYKAPAAPFNVDIRASSIAIGGKETLILYSTVTGGSAHIRYMWTCSNTNATISSSTSSQTNVTFLGAGTYTFTMLVTDTDNNKTATKSISITVRSTE